MIGIRINPTAGGKRSWLAAIQRARKRWEQVRSFNIPGALRSRMSSDFVHLVQNEVEWGQVTWTYQKQYYRERGKGMYGSDPAGSGIVYWGRINPQERLDRVDWKDAARGPRFLESMKGQFRRSGGTRAEVQILTFAIMNPYPKDQLPAPIMYYFREGWHSPVENKQMQKRPVDKYLARYQFPRLRRRITSIWRQAWRPLMHVT
ncbi:MAG: hypothetical protein JRD89_00080 [Deltaproteobacteria bacterium]|nr:hypothetical protein [Deltaproteobacteria bacterium]